MPSGFQITCANKNPGGMIVRLGGPGWSLSQHEVVQQIVTRHLRLYIVIGDETFEVGLRGEGSSTYLVLEPDGTPLHTIDTLQSC